MNNKEEIEKILKTDYFKDRELKNDREKYLERKAEVLGRLFDQALQAERDRILSELEKLRREIEPYHFDESVAFNDSLDQVTSIIKGGKE